MGDTKGSEARVPVRQRKRERLDLPHPNSDNGNLQFHMKLTLSKHLACGMTMKCTFGAQWGIGKRVWRESG